MQAEPDWKEMYALADKVIPRGVSDVQEREDLKSIGIERLLTVWLKFKSDGPATFRTWAAVVMRNAMVDEFRRKDQTPKPIRFEALRGCNGESKAELIRHYWDRLKPLLKPAEVRVGEAYVRYGDLSYREIAVKAGVRNEASARVHVCRIFKVIWTLENQEV